MDNITVGEYSKYHEEIELVIKYLKLRDTVTLQAIQSSATYLQNLSRNILHYANETYDFKGIEQDIDEIIRTIKDMRMFIKIIEIKAKANEKTD